MSGNIAALRLRNRMYAGALTGAALQAELADAYQLGAWRQLCAGGTGMAQMLSVPAQRSTVQASPAAADEVLRSGYGVGQIIESLLESPSNVVRACTTFDRALNNNIALQHLLESPSAIEFVGASPWGKARLLSAFARSANVANVLTAAINSQSALTMITDDAVAAAALRSSTGLPKVEVPAQSANGTSNVGAFASSENATYPAYRAFDKNLSTSWIPGAVMPQWLKYSFAAPVFVHTVDITPTAGNGPKDVRVQRSADGVTWEDVLPTTINNSGGLQTRYLSKAGKATHWRLYIDTVYAANQVNMQINELNFIGF